MLTNEQISSLQERLLKEKKEFEERLKQNAHFGQDEGFFHESMGELSSYDNHPADEGTELFEREKDIALNEHVEFEIKNIVKALELIKEGKYGTCQTCGKDIPFERLEALPSTAYCKEHSHENEINRQRPVEEEALNPPFGQFESEEADEKVSFDAEDAWQEVAKWGTSETPSDFSSPQDHYNDAYMEHDENIGYVEDFENFVGTDIDGKNIRVFPNSQHKQYERVLDEEGIMTEFGDLPAFEHDPYVERDE